jgi:hypothetical protein
MIGYLWGLSRPAETVSEQLLHLCKAVSIEILKLHGLPPKVLFLKTWAILGDSSKWVHELYVQFVLPTYTAVSGFLNFANWIYNLKVRR